MKKILVALCAVALIGLTGCKKDNVAPEEPSAESGSGQSDPERPPQSGTWADIPGVYSPAAKIVTVNEDGTLSETWRWEDDLLKVVKSDDGSEKVRFTHDERGRVKTMTINGEGRISGTVNVSYNGDQISRMSLMNGSSVSPASTMNSSSIRSDESVNFFLFSLLSIARHSFLKNPVSVSCTRLITSVATSSVRPTALPKPKFACSRPSRYR